MPGRSKSRKLESTLKASLGIAALEERVGALERQPQAKKEEISEINTSISALREQQQRIIDALAELKGVMFPDGITIPIKAGLQDAGEARPQHIAAEPLFVSAPLPAKEHTETTDAIIGGLQVPVEAQLHHHASKQHGKHTPHPYITYAVSKVEMPVVADTLITVMTGTHQKLLEALQELNGKPATTSYLQRSAGLESRSGVHMALSSIIKGGLVTKEVRVNGENEYTITRSGGRALEIIKELKADEQLATALKAIGNKSPKEKFIRLIEKAGAQTAPQVAKATKRKRESVAHNLNQLSRQGMLVRMLQVGSRVPCYDIDEKGKAIISKIDAAMSKLRAIGLTGDMNLSEDDEKALLMLDGSGRMTIAKLSRKLGRSRSCVSGLLLSLKGRGLVSRELVKRRNSRLLKYYYSIGTKGTDAIKELERRRHEAAEKARDLSRKESHQTAIGLRAAEAAPGEANQPEQPSAQRCTAPEDILAKPSEVNVVTAVK